MRQQEQPTLASPDAVTTMADTFSAVKNYFETGLRGALNSGKAFDSDIRQYVNWCTDKQIEGLPAQPGSLALYAADSIKQLNYRTLRRHLSSINRWHRVRNLPVPLQDKQLQIVLAGIRRQHDSPPKQAGAFTFGQLLSALPQVTEGETLTLTQIRDRAIILLGFAGAFRRSELVSINLEDLYFERTRLIVRIRKSKTNQFNEQEEKLIPKGKNQAICPYTWVEKWKQSVDRESGPLFVRISKGGKITDKRLADQWVNTIVKCYFNTSGDNLFTAHSLRASFVTQAIANGAGEIAIMRQTKHKTSEMIRRYVRLNDIRQYNAVNEIGF